MIVIIYLLAALEIWWDWRLIERKQRSPNYRGSNRLRVLIGVALWALWPQSLGERLFSPVMMFCNFWFVFDYGLNIARRVKNVYHLGTNTIDTFQKEYGGERVWFWIKAGLAVVSVVVYYLL